MKINIYICMVSVLLISLSSCELARDLDDFEPNYALDADAAIVDEASAELALAGVYSGFRQRSIGAGNPEIYYIPSLMSGLMLNSSFNTNQETMGYIDNTPIPMNASSGLGAYSRMYDIVNRCNWLIEKVALLSDADFDTPGRRAEILGEAKAVRATANFYLLRLFGQFYDTDSRYGITLRMEPARSSEALPRNTVAEVYEALIKDLDDAIADAPDLRARYYTNKTYAKGLKAKVMLYQGDYAGAAVLAGEVIHSSGGSFDLAPDYAGIFADHTSPALFETREVLFGSKGEPRANLGIGNYMGFWGAAHPMFGAFGEQWMTIGGQNITYDGDRIALTTREDDFYGLLSGKYRNQNLGETYEMIYHLRMAEVYLVYAEAHARSNHSVTSEALEALNAVRRRAGATATGEDGFETYPASIPLAQFLEAVRIEKYIELAMETGEEWFDLVRYHFVDGFDVTTVKPTATDPDKYILPIDGVTIEAGKNVVEQNPGY
ncbi:RagB/SusD family nutrient uptake outer membrane protein [Sinomicrobium oceani]|uniref:RagB/SusD family nutrient uptake outer membrane protein n=1 Tax=Sinomicrobium oceani TaxID=1150368 RepID=UPI00227B1B39|nr:RagB/SusD family nutrient uptake outer membrane protein [Sinomicrobium oceani]